MPTRIQIAKPDIVKHFDKMPSKVLTRREVKGVFEGNRAFWRLAKGMSLRKFIEFLAKRSKLEVVEFDFPHRAITLYSWDQVPFYSLLLSLRPDCYLSHYTAVAIHELTDQIPKTVTVNWEQTPKQRSSARLEQERIDAAFKRPTRLSKNTAICRGREIRLLNGQHTANLGVIEAQNLVFSI